MTPGREPSEEELREELEFHIAERERLNRESGVSDPEAAARRAFGNLTLHQEAARAVNRWKELESITRDLRLGARSLLRQPVFSAAAVLTIALGVGCCTAVFSIADRILFRPLPYPEPSQLISMGMGAPLDSSEFLLAPDYSDWSAARAVKSAAALTLGFDCDLAEANPLRLRCAQINAEFLPTFGVTPLLGRNFLQDEDRPGAAPAAIVSHRLWRTRFAGSPSIIGRKVPFDGVAVEVVGVLDEKFELPTLSEFDVLFPARLDPAREGNRIVRAFARVNPGVSIEQARESVRPAFLRSLERVPAAFRKEITLVAQPLRDRQAGAAARAAWTLLAAASALMLIACANVANLMFARASSRARETAIRSALGASRWNLLSVSFSEGLLIGLAGLGLAGGFAAMLIRGIVSIAPDGIPRIQQAGIDARVLIFCACATLAASVASGAAPELFRGAARRETLKHALLMTEVAVAVVLLSGALLLGGSLRKIRSAPLGFESRDRVLANIVLGRERYSTPERQFEFWRQLEEKLRGMPGTARAALADSVPPSGQAQAMIYSLIDVEGRPRNTSSTGGMVPWRAVTPGFFEVLGIPIVRGRGLSDEDRKLPGVVLSEALARRLFPNEDPLGQRIQPGRSGPWLTIVGISGTVANNGQGARPAPEYYLTQRAGNTRRRATAVMASSASVAASAAWIRRAVEEIDPAVPVGIETMEERVGDGVRRPKLHALVFGVFAGMGLLASAVGLYGLVAFRVARRTREIGVRIALGATPFRVARHVMAYSLAWVAAGAVAGLAGAWSAGRMLESMLFEVDPRDPFALAGAAVCLLVAAAAAAMVPAVRAARLDPIRAIRFE